MVFVILGDLSTLESWNLPTIDTSASVYLIIPIVAIVLGNFLFKLQLKNAKPDIAIENNISMFPKRSKHGSY
jgi:hypothetical protein